MREDREANIQTYNQSAEELARYFDGIGSRVNDIELAFKLSDNAINPKVLEIGCGNGRDAQEIAQRTNWYLGFDISAEMIRLAQNRLPDGEFEVADAVSYWYPPDLDIVFAFASLLHVDIEDFGVVFSKVKAALKPGGIFYLSLKYAPHYRSEVKDDQFGRRYFYFYNPTDIENMYDDYVETVHLNHPEKLGTGWFEMAIKKKSSRSNQ